MQHALVEVSDLTTVFKLAGPWTNNSQKFWEIMEQENMDKKLVPDDMGGTPVTAQNLAATITSIGKVLATEENSAGYKGWRQTRQINIQTYRSSPSQKKRLPEVQEMLRIQGEPGEDNGLPIHTPMLSKFHQEKGRHNTCGQEEKKR